jgi:hypothetical protein
LLLLPRLASAQEAAPAPDSNTEKYIGVSPSAGAKNPLPAPKSSEPNLVWTGFKLSEGGSQVFLQTTSAVTYELLGTNDSGAKPAKGGRRLQVMLRNCRIHLNNNSRKLDTRFFATPVAGVKARQKKKDVEVTITLKETSEPAIKSEAGPDGSQFVVLDFPPATTAPVTGGKVKNNAALENETLN